MSLVEACWTWCRDRVGWSSSQQPREEVLGGMTLASGALLMLLLGWRLPVLVQVTLWVLLAFASAFLLRRGWLKLFGPVLFYDMLCQARRSRYFVLRTGYAALMIFFLFIAFLEVKGMSLPAEKRYLLMAESFFLKFMAVQFVAVSLLTPAYVASAITDEKERRTLDYMLASDLRNREIVLSKLLSRVANLTLLILTGLPILSFLQFLGGIDPNLLLAGFLATFMTAVGLAAFSIFASVECRKSRHAVLTAYLVPLLYVLAGYQLHFVRASGTPFLLQTVGWGGYEFSLADIIDIFNAGNLPMALSDVLQAIYQGRIEFVLGPALRRYVIFHAVLALICTAWAVRRLRIASLRQANDTPRKGAIRLRARPRVWDFSLLWKEIFVDDHLRSWFVRLVIGILFLLSIGAIIWQILEYPRLRGPAIADWVTFIGTVVACLGILSVAVRAAVCIVGERDKNTFDFLLTTPLDSDTILKAKFLGCLLSLRGTLLWLAIIWSLAMYAGIFEVWQLPFLLAPILIYASVFILLGLWSSMISRSSARAIVFTVMSALGISLGHWLFALCCWTASGAGAREDFDVLFKFQAGMTPPFVMAFCHIASYEVSHWSWRPIWEMGGYCAAGLLIYCLAGGFLWVGVLLPRFREITNREEHSLARHDDTRYFS